MPEAAIIGCQTSTHQRRNGAESESGAAMSSTLVLCARPSCETARRINGKTLRRNRWLIFIFILSHYVGNGRRASCAAVSAVRSKARSPVSSALPPAAKRRWHREMTMCRREIEIGMRSRRDLLKTEVTQRHSSFSMLAPWASRRVSSRQAVATMPRLM